MDFWKSSGSRVATPLLRIAHWRSPAANQDKYISSLEALPSGVKLLYDICLLTPIATTIPSEQPSEQTGTHWQALDNLTVLFPEVTKIVAASTFAGEPVTQFHVGEGSDNKGRLHAETRAHFPKGPISNRHQRKVS